MPRHIYDVVEKDKGTWIVIVEQSAIRAEERIMFDYTQTQEQVNLSWNGR